MAKAPKCICASDLNDYIVVEMQTGAKDGLGGRTDEWSQVTDAYALIEPWRGKEQLKAAQMEGSYFYNFYIRLDRDVTIDNSMRIVWKDQIGKTHLLNIRTVIDLDNKHQFLEISAEEGKGT